MLHKIIPETRKISNILGKPYAVLFGNQLLNTRHGKTVTNMIRKWIRDCLTNDQVSIL